MLSCESYVGFSPTSPYWNHRFSLGTMFRVRYGVFVSVYRKFVLDSRRLEGELLRGIDDL